MVLPLAPLKRISSIRMPPDVWGSHASKPPARIKTTPAIARDHLRRMSASPCPRAVASAARVRFAASFYLWLIPYPKLERAQAVLPQLSTGYPETLLSQLYCLRNVAGPAIECRREREALEDAPRSLLQRLQMSNQKVE